MVRGTCLCGETVYEMEGEFRHMTHCHCSMCRKSHGTVFATYVGAPSEGFRWVGGAERLTHYESSPGHRRAFCSTCGSVAPVLDAAHRFTFVPAGNLAEDCGARPGSHIFVASAPPWAPITDALIRFDAYPPAYDRPPVETPARGSGRQGVVGGSCLCGAIAFEYEGAPLTMRNCHCSRCRRAKSAAHACNVFVDPAGFRWIRGEEVVVDYQLPEAERFGHAFCRACGSSMPRRVPGMPMVNVPAGALDDDPGARPTANIFVASKAPWFELTDEAPRYDEMSPR